MVKAWLWIAAFPALLAGRVRTPVFAAGDKERTSTRPYPDQYHLKTLNVLAVSADGTVLHAAGSPRIPLPEISADMVTLANITGRTVIATVREVTNDGPAVPTKK